MCRKPHTHTPRVSAAPQSAHTDPPPFTKKTLKDAIPPHCFERSALRGFAHIAVDVAELIVCAWAILQLDTYFAGQPLIQWPLWAVFWFYQGTTMFGLWIIAHEAGHGAFSAFPILNDVVGYVLHTSLYVPYFSWQLSHAKHHHYTNHMELDDPFVPTKFPAPDQDGKLKRHIKQTWELTVKSFVILVLGLPCYLLFNLGGAGWNKGVFVSHFDPNAPIYKPSDRWKINLSTFGILAWTYVLYLLAQQYGWATMVNMYYVPWLVNNAYLTAVTLLHHTHPSVPHFEAQEWTWLRGALCTIDRTLGRFLDYKSHKIVNTHVCHHLFSTIPFYHAEEATEAIKKVLGPYYNQDNTNYVVAFFDVVKRCNFVDGKGVLYFIVDELDH